MKAPVPMLELKGSTGTHPDALDDTEAASMTGVPISVPAERAAAAASPVPDATTTAAVMMATGIVARFLVFLTCITLPMIGRAIT